MNYTNFYILGNEAGFDNVVFKINQNELNDFIKLYENEENDTLFSRFYELCETFQSINVEQICMNNEKWFEFCTDILVFYILRYFLYDISIPYLHDLDDNMIDRIELKIQNIENGNYFLNDVYL